MDGQSLSYDYATLIVPTALKSGRVGRFFCPPFSGSCGVPCNHRRERHPFRVGTNSMCPPYPATRLYVLMGAKKYNR